MKQIVLLTGSELRHIFFRKVISADKNINVLASYCEGNEESLFERIAINKSASKLLIKHENLRSQAENFFFSQTCNSTEDFSNLIQIKKGDVNNKIVFEEIIKLNPDLIVSYGSSIINKTLIDKFSGKFINIHLGLSPYYRGSGTNVWPLINKEPEYVGTTFMHIDSGIDTGKIIHQIRADIESGDDPHSIGCKLIIKTCEVCKELISQFDRLESHQSRSIKNGRLYLRRDFDNKACKALYLAFSNNIVEDYIKTMSKRKEKAPIFHNNRISIG